MSQSNNPQDPDTQERPRSESLNTQPPSREAPGSSNSEPLDFDALFDSFAKVGDRHSEDITLRNVDKWFKQANLFNQDLTTTDTAILFAKVAKNKKKLTKEEFREFLKEISEDKKVEIESLESSLTAAGRPSFLNVTKPIRGSPAADTVERLSDSSSYTGIHKHRFDSAGRGLGLAGRYDVVNNDGYVQGYQNKGKYGSTENLDEEEKEK